jgi:hypothetical protein
MIGDTSVLKTRLVEILKLRSSASDNDILNVVRKLVNQQETEGRIRKLISETHMSRDEAFRCLREQDAARASNK